MEWLHSLTKKTFGADSGEAGPASDGDSSSFAEEPAARAVKFEVDEDSNAEGGGMVMDSMAYLTQPDSTFNSTQNDNASDSGDSDAAEEQPLEEMRTPAQPKKGRGRGRARKQSGDLLTQLEASPEGRQHSSTVKRKQTPGAPQPQPSLSQSLVDSPLRSPSPLVMSQMMLSQSLDSTKNIHETRDDVNDSDTGAKDAKFTPPKESVDAGQAADNDVGCQEEDIDFEPNNEPLVPDDIDDEQQQRRQRILQRMEMKKQAIYRSMLHLSENSYSFVYDDSSNGQSSAAMNGDAEPGLPFIRPGLKEQYEELRLLLQKGLLGYTGDDADAPMRDVSAGDDKNGNPFLPKIRSNVSVVMMGNRGQGKTLVLERCLASLSRLAGQHKERVMAKMGNEHPDELNEFYSQASFRVVRLNGLLYQGDSVVACVREIARQIGVMSREEGKRTKKIMKQLGMKQKRSKQTIELETPKLSNKKRKKDRSAKKSGQKTPITPMLSQQVQTPDHEVHNLRVRQSGFNTYIALLDEVLRSARIDGIPILIVLEEMETFLAGSHNMTDASQDDENSQRQLLLYHLLDRVADHKFLVSLVGMTTDLVVSNRLEKRVASRAEGTTKFIYFGHDADYDNLVTSLLGKFYTPPNAGEACSADECSEKQSMLDIREEVEAILRISKSRTDMKYQDDNDQEINDYELVQKVFQRNYNLLGSDMRWACRVFDVALGLLASDIDEHLYQFIDSENTLKERDSIPKLSPKHLAQALVTMGASLQNPSSNVGRGGPTQSALELIRWGKLLGNPKHYSSLLGTHPRLVALLDLSGPHVAILLAARRIVTRDDTRASAEDELDKGSKESEGKSATPMLLPLTYRRIQDEYMTSFVASGRYTTSSDRYPPRVLYRSCTDLMELDLIRMKKDQCRGGVLQYGQNGALSTGTNVSDFPLHVNLEWEIEFMGALRAGLLQCSTALREWGIRIN